LGQALVEAAEFILGEPPKAVETVSIDLTADVDVLRNKIVGGIQAVNSNQGILILTDMFGGTPSNLSYSFLEEGRIEVLSGVNLPIVVKAINDRTRMALPELASRLEAYGKKSIQLASSVLKGNKRASS
jgi:PTS system mannose-specific IIA component